MRALREAWREHRRRPTPFVLSVTSLATSLALAATLFGVTDALLFKPPPFEDPNALFFTDRHAPGAFDRALTPQEVDLLAEHSEVISVAGFAFPAIDPYEGEDVRVMAASVTRDFFTTLGVQPFELGGQGFWEVADFDTPAVVVGRDVYERLMPESRSGELVTAAGQRFRLAGIAPAGFDFPRGANLWIHRQSRSNIRSLTAVVRLRAKTTALNVGGLHAPVHLRPIQAYDHTPRAWSAVAVSLVALAGLAGAFIHQGAAWLTLLVSRRSQRQIRALLGATPRQLMADISASAGTVIVTAGVIATVLVPPGITLARHVLPAEMVAGRALHADWRVFLFLACAVTLGLVVLTIGIWWAELREERGPLGSYRTSHRSRSVQRRIQAVVLCFQMLLMVASGYMSLVALRSYRAAALQPLGFNSEHLLSVSLTRGARAVIPESDFHARLRTLRGVDIVAPGSLPLSRSRMPVTLSGEPAATAAEQSLLSRIADERRVGPGYLVTAGIRLIRGRDFDARHDLPGSAVVLSSIVARHLGDSGGLLGGTVWVNGQASAVVGIAADVWAYGPEAGPAPLVYTWAERTGATLVRTNVRPQSVIPEIRQVVGAYVQDVGAAQIVLASDRYAESVQAQRSQALILGLAAAFNVLFGAFGLAVGAVALTTAQLKDTAIRIAIGATTRGAIGVLVRRLGTLSAIGAGAGLLAGAAGATGVGHLWYVVQPADAVSAAIVISLVSGLLVCVVVRISQVVRRADLARTLANS